MSKVLLALLTGFGVYQAFLRIEWYVAWSVFVIRYPDVTEETEKRAVLASNQTIWWLQVAYWTIVAGVWAAAVLG